MVLSINTNIAALNASLNFNNIGSKGVLSIGRLASGLRINKAADDSSGMVIADSLQAQARGLGQAIRNANDAISIVQIADAALAESINIINTVRTKSIQAAQDGQTVDSRKAIQSDIQKLMEELDLIAKTTSFNGQKLLSGGFTDKFFQIGAYSGERVNLSIGSATADKIGHITTGELVLQNHEAGVVHLGINSSLSDQIFEIEPIDLAFDNSPEHGLGALANALNKAYESTGVRAKAVVMSKTAGNIRAGMTDTGFAVNNVRLGSFSVKENDGDGSLVKTINRKTVFHGVVASIDENSSLVLTSIDGRGIKVDTGIGSGNGTQHIFQGGDLITFGTISLKGRGPMSFDVKDLGAGNPVAVSGNGLDVKSPATMEADSKLATGSTLSEQSILKSPWTADQNLNGDSFATEIKILEQTSMAAGSSLGKGSILLTRNNLSDTITVKGLGETTEESLIKKGSILAKNSILGKGTELPSGNIVSAGTLFKGDGTIDATDNTTAVSLVKKDSLLAGNSVLASGTVLTGTAIVKQTGSMKGDGKIVAGSSLTPNSILASGTIVQGDAIVAAINGTTGVYSLTAGSILLAGSKLVSGTTLKGDAVVEKLTGITGDYNLTTGSRLESGTVILAGTTLTGTATVDTLPITGNFQLATNSKLESGSVLGANTILTDTAQVNAVTVNVGDFQIATGSRLLAGSVLGANTILTDTAQVNAVTVTVGDFDIATGSMLLAGSVLGVNTTLTDSAVVNTMNITVADLSIGNNSTLLAGTFFDTGTTINGLAKINQVPQTNNPGDTITLGAGTFLEENTFLEVGLNTTTGFFGPGLVPAGGKTTAAAPATQTFSLNTGYLAVGSILAAGSNTGPNGVTLNDFMTTTAIMTPEVGSIIFDGSSLAVNSVIGTDTASLDQDMDNTGAAMTLEAGSVIADGSILAVNSVIGTDTASLDQNMDNTGAAMTLEAGSVIADGSRLAATSVIGTDTVSLDQEMTIFAGPLTLTTGSTIFNGSRLAATSVIGPDDARLIADLDLNSDMTLASGSTIANLSSLEIGTVLSDDKLTLASGMMLCSDMTMTTGSKMGYGSLAKYNSQIWADATLIFSMTLEEAVELASDMPLATDLVPGEGSSFGKNSVLVQGSSVYLALELLKTMEISEATTLDQGSEISRDSGSLILSGTGVGGDATLAEAVVLENDFYISQGSVIGADSILKNGSSIGGAVETAHTESVEEHSQMNLGKGSILARGSILAEGTFLNDEILSIDGTIYPPGTFLNEDIIIDTKLLSRSMTLESGSKIESASILNTNFDVDMVATNVDNISISRLSDILVLSREQAQKAIEIADAALKDLGKIRSLLGSVQNQLSSTIAGITVTQINLYASESSIRDVDLSEEMQNFSKIKILQETGSFALNRANTRAENLLSLLTDIGQS